MNMRRKLSSIGFIGLLLFLSVLSSCKNKAREHQHESGYEHAAIECVYSCPMHPEGIRPIRHPATAPSVK
jgi:hypothetical protein